MRRILIIALALTLWAALGHGQDSRSAEVQLKAALHKEQVEGDLKGAIEAYRKLAQSSDRSVAARALVRMGQCYEKLGEAQAQEARKAYERVVREFGDQRDPAGTARSRLAVLTKPSAGSVPALAMRRIYYGPGLDWCNGLSSDIRYLSHPDWSTGNIAVADLRNGQVRRVTSDGRIGQPHGEFGECSIFSPNDKQIAFFWHNKDGLSELRTIGLDGSGLRVLYRLAQASYILPFDWSSDGKQILAQLHFKDGSRQIVTISAADGTARILKTLAFSGLSMTFSPDGRYIAYSTRTSATSSKQDIFVITADGSRETPLIQHPAEDNVLGWSPDGEKLFFGSDRTGSYGVWSIEVENGQPSGAPVLAKADVAVNSPIRFVNGTLFYRVVSQMTDVYIASVDPETGKLQSKPTPARSFFSGSNAAPDWSPDGNFLAYRSVRGPASPLKPPPLLSILNLQTSEERQVRPALEGIDFNDGPHWSPDGRSLLVIGLQGSPESGIHKVDVDSGATTTLVKTPPGQWILHALWSRDGNSVIYPQGGPTRILRRDLSTGKDVKLAAPRGPGGVVRIALSPDGQWLAFTSREPAVKPVMKLHVVPVGGSGEAREIHRTAEDEGIGDIAWTPDGRFILFVKPARSDSAQNRPRKREVWRITPDGQTMEQVDLPINGRFLRFSPDGRRLAFSSGEGKSELWALENIWASAARKP